MLSEEGMLHRSQPSIFRQRSGCHDGADFLIHSPKLSFWVGTQKDVQAIKEYLPTFFEKYVLQPAMAELHASKKI
ncbi:hypothetical protein I3843_14G076700 [Carya illinoinensis]|uniref:Uncharacterized protein n=1 Tax=Carya illinoinensis TaxID=32201 RepID=A0A922ABP8_CARIL|nr:hypothetical protein I3842_14G078400 [Carya illinoinensis]KAG7947091.1 hypothetical protein I3843_14G076700 [Carya illinoinensis]